MCSENMLYLYSYLTFPARHLKYIYVVNMANMNFTHDHFSLF